MVLFATGLCPAVDDYKQIILYHKKYYIIFLKKTNYLFCWSMDVFLILFNLQFTLTLGDIFTILSPTQHITHFLVQTCATITILLIFIYVFSCYPQVPKSLSAKQKALIYAYAELEEDTPGQILGVSYDRDGKKK